MKASTVAELIAFSDEFVWGNLKATPNGPHVLVENVITGETFNVTVVDTTAASERLRRPHVE